MCEGKKQALKMVIGSVVVLGASWLLGISYAVEMWPWDLLVLVWSS
jgi:hypothetical protein